MMFFPIAYGVEGNRSGVLSLNRYTLSIELNAAIVSLCVFAVSLTGVLNNGDINSLGYLFIFVTMILSAAVGLMGGAMAIVEFSVEKKSALKATPLFFPGEEELQRLFSKHNPKFIEIQGALKSRAVVVAGYGAIELFLIGFKAELVSWRHKRLSRKQALQHRKLEKELFLAREVATVQKIIDDKKVD